MDAHATIAIAQMAILLVTILLIGFALNKRWLPAPRFIAWVLAVGGPVVALLITRHQAPFWIMIALILALLYAMKAVVAVSDRRQTRLPLRRWLAYTLTWPGMRPGIFQSLGEAPLPGASRLIRKGAVRILAGLGLFYLAFLIWQAPTRFHGVFWMMAVLALLFPALSLILHFGLLNVLTGFWRWRGVPAANLFNAPMRSLSLGEFWGRRWNIAFAEMTAVAVFRPLRQRYGEGAGRLGAFLFSGLAHELAISVPVQAGYGLPTLYFALQAMGAYLEKRYALGGRFWTAMWIMLPAPLVFHTNFIIGVMLPLLGKNS